MFVKQVSLQATQVLKLVRINLGSAPSPDSEPVTAISVWWDSQRPSAPHRCHTNAACRVIMSQCLVEAVTPHLFCEELVRRQDMFYQDRVQLAEGCTEMAGSSPPPAGPSVLEL